MNCPKCDCKLSIVAVNPGMSDSVAPLADGAKVIGWRSQDSWFDYYGTLVHARGAMGRGVHKTYLLEFVDLESDRSRYKPLTDDKGDARAKELGYTIKRNSSETPSSASATVELGETADMIRKWRNSEPHTTGEEALFDLVQGLTAELSRQQARLTRKGL